MIINENHKIVLNIILNIHKNIAVGGSICLKAYGLMSREIGDLDLFISKDTPIDDIIYSFVDPNDLNTYDIQLSDRVPLEINGIKIDIFKVPRHLLSYVKMDIDGLSLNVQNPCLAIAAKVNYSETNPKHREDIEFIRLKFKELVI